MTTMTANELRDAVLEARALSYEVFPPSADDDDPMQAAMRSVTYSLVLAKLLGYNQVPR